MICMVRTESVNFFLLEQYSEVTLVDVSLSKCRDTLELTVSVFDRKLHKPGHPTRQS